MKEEDDWSKEDATWRLLEKATVKKASEGFVEQTARAVENLPQASRGRAHVLHLSSWIAVAACMALAALFFLKAKTSEMAADQEDWVQMKVIAQEEILLSLDDDLEFFSDQELLAIMGF